MRIRGGMIAEVAPYLGRAGYHTIDVPGGSCFAVVLRYLHEDPIEYYRLIRRVFGTARLRTGTRPSSTGRYGVSPRSLLDFYVRYMIERLGHDAFWVYDCLFDMREMEYRCRVIHEAGGDAIPAVMYGISPVHTDEWFAERVREMVSWGIAASIYVEDAAGILTPERARTLMPALVEAAGEVPVELHCHNTTGLAPINYLIGVEAGVRILHTCSRPVANGPSLPSTEMTLLNLEQAGHSHSIDMGTLAPVADRMERMASLEGFPLGVCEEYDSRVYQHQLPGGMTGTFKAQLAQHGMEERYRAILDEIPQVRHDLGYPISATPFSQLLGTQAVLNVMTGERYAQTTDEVALYVLGAYGQPPAPIDEDVRDRILASPSGRRHIGWTRSEATLDDVRQEFGGRSLSDEELFLRNFAPVEDIQRMRAAGPLAATYPLETTLPVAIRHAIQEAHGRHVQLKTVDGYALELRR